MLLIEWWSYFLEQAFGQSFLQPDIHLFKQNLFYLETLNTKQKLYHKVRFLRLRCRAWAESYPSHISSGECEVCWDLDRPQGP